MKSCTRTSPNRKMARNRPKFGKIGREAGQMDEESMRSPRKRHSQGRKTAFGGCFSHFWFLDGLAISQNFTGRQTDAFQDLFAHMFSCIFCVCRLLVHQAFHAKIHNAPTTLAREPTVYRRPARAGSWRWREKGESWSARGEIGPLEKAVRMGDLLRVDVPTVD